MQIIRKALNKIDSALRLLARGFILAYRFLLWPLKHALFGETCRFSPTCSRYALECFQNHGFLTALRLTVRRLLRCQPLCKGGYDPVPPSKAEKP